MRPGTSYFKRKKTVLGAIIVDDVSAMTACIVCNLSRNVPCGNSKREKESK